MPRKLLTIWLLLVFGVSTFTFKTHYCYHLDGTRFHGDCSADIREDQKKGDASQAHFHERHYNCIDLQLDKHYKESGYTFPNIQDHYFILPEAASLPPCIAQPLTRDIPVFSSRGGPPLSTPLLRGPPAI